MHVCLSVCIYSEHVLYSIHKYTLESHFYISIMMYVCVSLCHYCACLTSVCGRGLLEGSLPSVGVAGANY